jgi:glyoxylase-like metal-dependent hydrolase (beta-lactamase superfamily II)
MKKIVENIYIEGAYPGVTLGALHVEDRALLIDSPPRPEDARTWLAALRSLGISAIHMLIILDSHPDRTIGARAMNTTVIAQNETVDIFSTRSAMFKAQNVDSGAEWELCTGLSGIRWHPPNIAFSDRAILKWGEYDVALEHHPGPSPGSTWVVIPDHNIVFVGDTVTVKQPPLLEKADIPSWVISLDLLLSIDYSSYTIISGRGGPASVQAIRDLRKFLVDVLKHLERLDKKNSYPDATEKLVPKLLDKFKFPAKFRGMYTSRLRYGLFHYYAKHYRPAKSAK